jgi:hypothetical protein
MAKPASVKAHKENVRTALAAIKVTRDAAESGDFGEIMSNLDYLEKWVRSCRQHLPTSSKDGGKNNADG